MTQPGLVIATAIVIAATLNAADFRKAANMTQMEPVSAETSGVQTDKASGDAIRPFKVHVPDADVADLRQRLAATRWPDRETVADQSQGVQLARLQQLVQYWGSGYDWRKAEAKLNAFPQFKTNIDGLDIHFIHVRSREKNALPLLITHGWPGSVFEQIKLIGPLTDPTAFGGRAEDAFDVVIPSLPGYGFSSRPTETGWGPDRIARAWDVLMKRLGYTRYVSQGGDYGSLVNEAMGRLGPAGLLGIHINLPATLPPEIDKALATGAPAPAGISEQERAAYEAVRTFVTKGNFSYALMMASRPQAIGYELTDSPAGLAAFFLIHSGFTNWTYDSKSPTKDEVLDDFTLYWLTNTSTSAARSYRENGGRSLFSATAQNTAGITIPVAITVFPDEVYRAPETWARRAFPNLIYFHEVDRGGHFAAWEYPDLFAAELRAAFKSLR